MMWNTEEHRGEMMWNIEERRDKMIVKKNVTVKPSISENKLS